MAYLKITPDFIDFFLKPLSSISERCSLEINDGKIESVSASKTSIIVYISQLIETDLNNSKRICLPSIGKFTDLLEKATDLDENNMLTVHDNKLVYASKQWRFKYFLLDDNLLQYPINKSKLVKYEAKTSFKLSRSDIKQIASLKNIMKEFEKIYFKFLEDGVITVSLTDYAVANKDELSVTLESKYDGEPNLIGCSIDFDIIRVLSQNKHVENYDVKYNGSSFLFSASHSYTDYTYIISESIN